MQRDGGKVSIIPFSNDHAKSKGADSHQQTTFYQIRKYRCNAEMRTTEIYAYVMYTYTNTHIRAYMYIHMCVYIYINIIREKKINIEIHIYIYI